MHDLRVGVSVQINVIIESGAEVGEERWFSDTVVRIGRGSDNDWILADETRELSRYHLELEHEQHGIVLRDLSSSGTYVNDEPAPVGRGRSRILRDGDRLRLGPYILRVQTGETAGHRPAPSGVPAPFEDPFAPPLAPDPERARAIFDRTWLVRHGVPGPADHPLGDQPGHRDEPRLPTPGQRPVLVDELFGDRRDALGAPTTAEEFPLCSAPPAAASMAADSFCATRSENATPLSSTPAADQAMGVSSDVLGALLDGCGLDRSRMARGDEAGFARLAGRQLRELAFALVLLLQGREEAKGAMRAARTQIGADGNNPLKFCATAEDAAAAVLLHRGLGFMEPENAVREAVRDVQQHEMALLASVRDAVHSLLDALDPEAFERDAKRGLLARLRGGPPDARCWRAFRARHQEIAAEAERRFLGSLGDDFVNAYERHNRGRPRGCR